MIKFVLIFASNIKGKPCMSIDTCRGYRPSSALQAVISVYLACVAGGIVWVRD